MPTQFTQNGDNLYMTTGHWETTSLGSALRLFGGGSSVAWWGTAAKTFVSNFVSPKFYKQELSNGGCLNTFLEGVERADVLGPALSGSPSIAETNINALANGVAVNYAASRLLTVPFRSSTVRSILKTGEAAAETFAPAYLDYLELSALGREGLAVYHGKCK